MMFAQTYLEVTLDDIPKEKPENTEVGMPVRQKPSKTLQNLDTHSLTSKNINNRHFLLQDRYERRQGGARHRRDRGETPRDRARHSRDTRETARDTRETGARQGRDTGETARDTRETLARQKRDMAEDENMNIYF